MEQSNMNQQRSQGSSMGAALGDSMDPVVDSSPPNLKGPLVQQPQQQQVADEQEDEAAKQARDLQRIKEAERILEEIAKEYAAKRAAGLVPTIPVPARTLLWQELARNDKRRIGTRGQCVYGRDQSSPCGCSKYKKKRLADNKPNPGGICENCNHGAPWHRIVGSSYLKKSLNSNSTATTKTRRRLAQMLKSSSSPKPATAATTTSANHTSRTQEQVMDLKRPSAVDDDEYDDDEYVDEEYDDEYDEDDDDEDDDDIALEIARPYSSQEGLEARESLSRLALAAAAATGSGGTSLGSNFHSASSPTNNHTGTGSFSALHSNMGLLSTFGSSSTTSTHNRLEKILKMIQQLEAKGLSEEEIESQIQQSFPRVSSHATNVTNRTSLSLDGPDATTL